MSDTKQQNTKATHIVFLLDASGSMELIRAEAIELFNQHVNEVRGNSSPKTTVTFATFGTKCRPIIHYIGQTLDRLEKLTPDNYVPDGKTPLNDCLGKMCERVETELILAGEDTAVLVIVVTDGLENYSGRWQSPEEIEEWHAYTNDEIKQLISRLESTGCWTFTFMGANQSKEKINQRYGIKHGNIHLIIPNHIGMRESSLTLSTSTARYLDMRRSGKKKTYEFFEKKEDEEN